MSFALKLKVRTELFINWALGHGVNPLKLGARSPWAVSSLKIWNRYHPSTGALLYPEQPSQQSLSSVKINVVKFDSFKLFNHLPSSQDQYVSAIYV